MWNGKWWSAAERVEVWRLDKAGESQSSIGLALGRKSGSIFAQLVPFGDIAPRRQRSRSARVLSLAEREEISRGLAAGASIRSIAQALGRGPSTVCRKVRRHGGGSPTGTRYRASAADWRAWERARRPIACLMSEHRELQGLVAGKLQFDWSPQQISGWLKTQSPADESMRVSPETIYRTLFVQARGALKKELRGHLRG